MNSPTPPTRFNYQGFAILAASTPSLSYNIILKQTQDIKSFYPCILQNAFKNTVDLFFHGYHAIIIYNKINKRFDII